MTTVGYPLLKLLTSPNFQPSLTKVIANDDNAYLLNILNDERQSNTI